MLKNVPLHLSKTLKLVLLGVTCVVIGIFLKAALPKIFGWKYFLSFIAMGAALGIVGRRLFRVPVWTLKLYLVVMGLLFGAFFLEVGLTLVDPHLPREKRLLLPPEWQFHMVDERSYLWQGHLHHFNSQMFRGPEWPARRPDTYRIMVVGDSLTFGYGVDEQTAYPMRLQTLLSKNYRVEVLNLGVSGFQSEDIVRMTEKYLPELQPQLVIYGVCLNDFLPSGTAEYTHQRFIHLPASFASHTAVGMLMNDMYDKLLRKVGLKNDFYEDILQGLQPWAPRFGKDLMRLNRDVHQSGRPPLLALVLNQFPEHARALELTRLAESLMQNSGAVVVSAQPYVWQYSQNHIPLYVSRWEGHPNERAHDLFARLLLTGIFSNAEIKASLIPYEKRSSK